MKIVRPVLVVVILLNLGLLAAAGPLRSTLGRYDLARKQAELRKLAVENRALLGTMAEARRPERVAARAAALGLNLTTPEPSPLAVEPRPLPIVPPLR